MGFQSNSKTILESLYDPVIVTGPTIKQSSEKTSFFTKILISVEVDLKLATDVCQIPNYN